MAGHQNITLVQFSKHWLNDPLPAPLMADLADIMEDEEYTPEKRAHQIVWQALKYGMNHPTSTAREAGKE